MIAGVLAGAALLLVAAGAGKVADPSRTVGALRALRWPSSPGLVRAGGLVETLLGVAVLVVGGRPLALLVAASYLGFAAFVLSALASGAPIGTCGCFARADTEPSSRHVVVVGLLAADAVVAAATDEATLADASWTAWVVAPLVAVLAYGLLTMQPGRSTPHPESRQ
jgi:methylamine utilization protein MauE